MMDDMIVFGEDWGRHPSSTQHLVKRLADQRRVLWVNSIGMRRPRLTIHDMNRLLEKSASMFSKPTKTGNIKAQVAVPDNMRVLSPVAIPWPGNPAANLFNRHALTRQIKAEMANDNISKPIVWCSLPTAVVACDTLEQNSIIYYCGDDFGAWQGVDHKPVMEAEAKLVSRADLIIASSEELFHRFPKDKTLLVEHGVDHTIFATSAPRPYDLPTGKPIAGFFGTIGDRIHVEAIADAAEQMPDWDFVMIGPIQTDCTSLRAQSNVHFLGERSHEALAGYVQNWDVSLLPFRQGKDMDASNPLKLREYFAAGTPIASTRFKALSRYERLVRVAEQECDFPAAIKRAFGDKKYNHLRRAFVAGESWDAQAAKIESVLATL